MNYGFVIDNDSCIGCHACSTACKSENDVPLGVHRTWVKSVETGAYPDVRRSFQVTRCNHCANPPCARICPVTAMYQRADGIVEFDPDVCIGCKACLQACPYDAIYIDPETGSAAKCHYCAHRVEVGLEPACVVVCPEHAIIAGDLDDPMSEISQVVASNRVTVRKPEQGTAPKLFYIGGEDAALHPTATERTPATYAWSDVVPLDQATGGDGAPTRPALRGEGPGTRGPQHQGLPEAGPIQIGRGRMAEQMVQVVWNAQHKVPWHWQVPAYLVTKAVAAGLFILTAAAVLLGLLPLSGPDLKAAGVVVLAFLGITTLLLVFDLEHPARFLRILTRPQWSSWLARGAYLLVVFSGVATVWVGSEFLGDGGPGSLRTWLLSAGVPFAIGAAVYTAFLFGQAEGRDLWQSSLLPFHMTLQATMAGAAAALLIWPDHTAALGQLLGVILVMDLLILAAEGIMPHASDTAATAAHDIRSGRFRWHFWGGSVFLGHVLPLAILWIGVGAPLIAAVAVVGGLYLHEHAFVTAPQLVPNS